MPLLDRRTWTLTIAGVDKSALIERRSLRSDWTRGGFANLYFATFDLTEGAGAYRPAIDAEVVLTVDAVVRYRGFVTSIGDTPMGGIRRGTRIAVVCSDYSMLLDRVTVVKDYSGLPNAILYSSVANPSQITTATPHGYSNGQTVRIEGHVGSTPSINNDYVITVTGATTFTIPVNVTVQGGAGTVRRIFTLKQIVQDLHTSYLSSNYGITLDGTMADGPVMNPITFNGESVKAALDVLASATGWVYRVTPAKELQMFALGVKTASFSLDGSNTIGPVQWQRTRQEFANRIVIYAGGDQKIVGTETFVHDGSSPSTYQMAYPASLSIDDPWPNVLIVDGAVVQVVGWGQGYLPSPAWYWDATTAQLVQESGAYNPAAGAVITVTYTRQYPVRVTAEDATDVQPPPTGRGPWEKVFLYPDVTDKGQAQTLATALLAQYFSTTGPRKLQLPTTAGFAMPGDQVGLTFSNRTVSGNWHIETAAWSLFGLNLFKFDFALTEGTVAVNTWIHEVQELFTGAGVGAVTVSGGVVSNPPPSGAAFSAPIQLGGSRQLMQSPSSGVWVPAIDYFVFLAPTTFSGLVRVELWARDAAVGAQARLRNVTDSTTAGTSSVVTSQTPTETTFAVSIVAGKRYRLEISNNVSAAGVACIGALETV